MLKNRKTVKAKTKQEYIELEDIDLEDLEDQDSLQLLDELDVDWVKSWKILLRKGKQN